MAHWRCVVLAISCALVGSCLSAPSSHHPAAAPNSNQLAFEDVLAHLRNKRQDNSKQCQDVGGYCRYHEDCCSQLCLSFSYKCVNRPAQSPFNPVIPTGQNAGAQAGAADVVNRFGDSNSSVPARQCTEFGGYCQRSTDCCSGTCLSFSYKCIGKSNTPFFRPPSSSQNGFIFEVGQQLPSPDNAITIEELVNRFGTGNEDNPLSTNSVLPAGNAVTGRPQNTSSISGSTPRPINASTNTNPNCVGTGGQCRFSNQCCSNLCVQLTAGNQFCADQVQQQSQPGGTTTPPQASRPTTTVTQQQQCLVIGSKCYAHAECCSTRCHMFLHQCVT